MANYKREIRRDLGTHEEYTPINLAENNTLDELKREYTRMRKQLISGVRRIEKSGEFGDTQIVKTPQQFPGVSTYTKGNTEDRAKLEVAMKLSQLEMILSAKTSTLTGLRKERADIIDTLHGRGYKNINKENFADFTKFMESTRAITLAIMQYRYDRSGRAVGADRNKRLELFNLAQQKGITEKSLMTDFRYYVKHMDELQSLPDYTGGRKSGIKKIRATLKNRRM